ncbi:MAG: LysR family transcriptional regulator [Betaproteobacteria bacterium]|nr:LysR family transcriptional regulator [Betaproteobacteria bacterium]
MRWDDVRIFLAVARGGSLIAAGERLAMSPASVARHVEELERRLGVTLFLRSRNGYALSDAGLAVVGEAERAEGALAALVHGATGAAASLAGTVRVAMPETFASALLMPRLGSLLAEHEGLRLEIVTAVHVADLSRREADLSLRLVRPSSGNVVISRIGSMAVGLYAAAEYRSRHPSEISDGGTGHRVIAWDEKFQDIKAARWLAQRLPHARPVLSATSAGAQLAACESGLGIAALPRFLADARPGLVRIGGPEASYAQDIWMVVQRDIAATARIRTVAELLRAAVRDAAPVLSGQRPGSELSGSLRPGGA